MGKQNFDPYEELGISRDAGPEDIRKAYRDRAKETHPDHPGGSKEKFALVALAKSVLSDGKRRAQFDRTGKVDDSTREDANAEAMSLIMGAINGIIDGDHKANDPLAQDILAVVEVYFNNMIDGFRQDKVRIDKRLARNERALKKFKRKSQGPNLIAIELTKRSNTFRKQIADLDVNIEKHTHATLLLKEYEFEPDPVEPQDLHPAFVSTIGNFNPGWYR